MSVSAFDNFRQDRRLRALVRTASETLISLNGKTSFIHFFYYHVFYLHLYLFPALAIL